MTNLEIFEEIIKLCLDGKMSRLKYSVEENDKTPLNIYFTLIKQEGLFRKTTQNVDFHCVRIFNDKNIEKITYCKSVSGIINGIKFETSFNNQLYDETHGIWKMEECMLRNPKDIPLLHIQIIIANINNRKETQDLFKKLENDKVRVI